MNNNMNNNIHKNHDQPNNKLTLNKQNKNNFTVFHQTIYGLLNKKKRRITLHFSETIPTNYMYNRTPLK